VDFTYKREFDNNQRSNLLSAFDVIDSLKESIKKADRSENDRKMLKSPLDNEILDDSNDKDLNNNKENVVYYTSNENLTQTYDNQILQTEKNYLVENDISKNIQTIRNYVISGNKNPNKVLLRNPTIESDSN